MRQRTYIWPVQARSLKLASFHAFSARVVVEHSGTGRVQDEARKDRDRKRLHGFLAVREDALTDFAGAVRESQRLCRAAQNVWHKHQVAAHKHRRVGMTNKAQGSRLTFSNIISLIALFVALGGSAYAAGVLPANSVGRSQLQHNAVTSSKIAPNSVGRSGTQARIRDVLRDCVRAWVRSPCSPRFASSSRKRNRAAALKGLLDPRNVRTPRSERCGGRQRSERPRGSAGALHRARLDLADARNGDEHLRSADGSRV